MLLGNPQDGIMVKLVVSLLQLSKMALNHTGEREVLGKLFGWMAEFFVWMVIFIIFKISKSLSFRVLEKCKMLVK